jgi:predicted O-methyltransferase YrrM
MEKAHYGLVAGGKRDLPDYKYLNLNPGEHYRLLKAMVQILKPKTSIEIGTFTGLGTIALHEAGYGYVHTFDIIPWDHLMSHLTPEHFKDRMAQHIADLTDLVEYRKYSHLFQNADIIFMDAPKDGVFEPKMVDLLLKLTPKKDRILVMDDIWFDCMQPLWRSIKLPKIDITSLGHWSGTGIVDLSLGGTL